MGLIYGLKVRILVNLTTRLGSFLYSFVLIYHVIPAYPKGTSGLPESSLQGSIDIAILGTLETRSCALGYPSEYDGIIWHILSC